MPNKLSLLCFKNLPIFQQLQLEEALLRTDTRNIFLVNEGSPDAVIMGISGKAKLLVNEKILKKMGAPLIKRFSGGGTVFVDSNTVFMSFICNHSALNIKAYPEHIMRWSGNIYKGALKLPEFQLRENDYVLDTKKCGGNAQYFRKDRWLHHSSFLWDFNDQKMDCLKHPHKKPNYRGERKHHDFLCRLKTKFQNKKLFIHQILDHLGTHFEINQDILESDLKEILKRPHRKATTFIISQDMRKPSPV